MTFDQQAELAIAKGNEGNQRGAQIMSRVMQFCRKDAGPFGIVRTCTICSFHDYRQSGCGRGSGMREGNKQRGRLYQHIKLEHPEYVEWLATQNRGTL